MSETEPEPTPSTTPDPKPPSPQPTAEDPPRALSEDAPPPPGRPVRLEPTPPGFRRLVLGASVALLAPLFGILIGSSVGTQDTTAAMSPLYWGFFIGGLIGAAGLVVAGLGGMSLMRHSATRNAEESA